MTRMDTGYWTGAAGASNAPATVHGAPPRIPELGAEAEGEASAPTEATEEEPPQRGFRAQRGSFVPAPARNSVAKITARVRAFKPPRLKLARATLKNGIMGLPGQRQFKLKAGENAAEDPRFAEYEKRNSMIRLEEGFRGVWGVWVN